MTDKTIVRAPSSATAPDLDWSQIRETVQMLHLAIAQIEGALRDGEDSVGALTESFTDMIGQIESISIANKDLPDNKEIKLIKETIEGNCQRVTGGIHATIVAFQFYDKPSQRLTHVSHGMSILADLICDQQRLYNPYEWRGLQETVRSRFSMREEQEMFDAVLSGMSVEEALAAFTQKQAVQAQANDDIELF